MCESEYDAATRDDPLGANANAVIPATASPRRPLARPHPHTPASTGTSASTRTPTGSATPLAPRESRRTSQSLITPSAAPAETAPARRARTRLR